MHAIRIIALSALLGASLTAPAESLTRDAAIGGALGGALGGAVGAELGGRQGAIVGAGIGAAAGTAINTRDYASPAPRHDIHYYDGGYRDGVGPAGVPHQGGGFCPPGQAKKGRC